MDINFFFNKYLKEKLGVDKAISFTLGTQIVSLIRSLLSIVLVTKYLTANEQGFYYTFMSILAIQIFFELGFSNIITQYAAHECAHLKWENGVLNGDNMYLSRLNSLLNLTLKWFSVMSIILLLVLVFSGFIFFSYFGKNYDSVNWQMPWIVMAITTAINLFISPFISFYEGLGKVEKIAKIRLYVLIASTIGFFLALILDAKLYAYAVNNIIALGVNVIWLFTPSVKRVLLNIWDFPIKAHTISWRNEIFPYQWKIALSWISGYFIFQLFNPILFSTVGAKAAGQMGMSQAALNGIFGISNSWLSTKVPLFSGFIARREYDRLDNIFNTTLKQALVVLVVCILTLFIGLYVLKFYGWNIVSRFLDLEAFLILTAGSIILFITNALSTYLRCHKEEPFLLISICSGILNVILMYISSKYFGIIGMVISYNLVMIIGLIWGYYIFTNKKKIWHKK